MLLSRAVLDGVVAGEIDLAFRRWTRRTHAPGGSQRTAVGVIAFDAVEVVDPDRITDAEAGRAGTDLTSAELDEVVARLADMDRRSHRGAWTRQHLELIDARPAELAEELAASIGREKRPFKADVRRLKELGLTESLRVGYRLSARGRAVLAHLRAADQPGGP